MPRRAGIIALPIFLILSACLVLSCGGRGPRGRVTNVVLIVVDTLRPDHLGCYGYPAVSTPAIDGLAQGGTLFEQAITPVPVTLPAFASLLTSTHPPTHGVRDNGLYALNEEMLTLAEILKDEGFRTAAFLGSVVMDSTYGLAQGFDTYEDNFEGLFRPFRPEYLPLADELRWNQRRAETVTRSALDWIKANRRKQFFALIHYFDPHAYYDPPPPFDSLYAANLYDGEIAYTDYQIAHLLSGIQSFRIPGRTLVVLTADHGEGLMEHNEAQHGLFLYDSTLRVPLIFSCPEVCPAGLRIPRQVGLVDVAPTVLALVGIRTPGSFQGTNLAPFFDGLDPGLPDLTYCETLRPRLSYGWSDLEGVRTEEWKYIRAPRPELYDLVKDGRETENLAGSEETAGTERRMAARLDSLARALTDRAQARAAELPRDEATRERLASLGYLAGMGSPPGADAQTLPDPKDEMDAFNRRQLASYYSRVGSALLRAGQAPAAIAALTRALEIEPASPVRHSNLGTAYVQNEEPEKAIAAYREALRLDPRHTPAGTGLATLYEMRGDTLSAISTYRKVLEAVPDAEPAIVGLSMLELRRGRPQTAADLLRQKIRTHPDNATFLSILVEALRQMEAYGEAAVHLERLTVLQPLNPDPPFFLASTLVRLDRREEAIRWYRRAIELDPSLSDAYYNIACIYSLQDQKARAIEWLRLALDHGFTDFRHMRQDRDLESLRGDPAFESLFPSGA